MNISIESLREKVISFIKMKKSVRKQIAIDFDLYSSDMEDMIDIDFSNLVFKRARQKEILDDLCRRIIIQEASAKLDPVGN